MKYASKVTDLIGIDYPIIQGPFGGGISTTKLASSVSNLGGLGSFGAHLLKPDEIEALCGEMRSLTKRPFAINLWVSDRDDGMDKLSQEVFENRRQDYQEAYRSLKIDPPAWPERSHVSLFERQAEAILRAKPKVFSFVFGIPSRDILSECRRRGIVTIGAATTIEEAEAVEAAGVDIVLATGFEAGGHRPSFLRSSEDSLVGGISLVPAVRDRINVPLVAAGGVADSRGMRAMFALGADAVQIGTAFLACVESGAVAAHRGAILDDKEGRTQLTRAFTGRLARFLPNAFTNRFESEKTPALPFPAQSWLTTPIKQAAHSQDDRGNMALYAGQSAPLVRHRCARDLMKELTDAL